MRRLLPVYYRINRDTYQLGRYAALLDATRMTWKVRKHVSRYGK